MSLSPMDRRSRALWQQAAARKRLWYAPKENLWFLKGHRRSSTVVREVKFHHNRLLNLARSGAPFEPYWWV